MEQAPSENSGADSGETWGKMVHQPDFYARRENANNAPKTAGEVEAAEIANQKRQQRKIMAYFTMDSANAQDVITMRDVNLPDSWRENFMQRMANGQISNQAEEDFLRQIKPRMLQVTPETILNETMLESMENEDGNRFYWQALRELTKGETSADGIRKLSMAPAEGELDLRTPVGFQKFRHEFMRPAFGDEAASKQRAQALDWLEKRLYGKQAEYYHAFEDLRRESYMNQFEQMQGRAEQRKFGQGILRVLNRSTIGASAPIESRLNLNENFVEPASSRVKSEAERMREKGPEQLSRKESERLLTNAVIDGDPWERSDGTWNLTPEFLRDFGLGPKFESSANGARVCLSDVYQLAGKRLAAVAYVPTDRGVKVRTYYKSNSQGLWRYLPDYVRKDDGSGKPSWFGKGYDEASTTLPAELQKSLAQIEETGVKDVSNKTDPWFIFAGTAKAYDSKYDYAEALRTGTSRGDYYREVAREPMNVGFEAMGLQKDDPESLQVSGGLAPNFAQEVLEYDGVSSLAGKFQAECFSSQDKAFIWTFCNDERGRVWVGNVDVRFAPTSTGLARDWVSLGDFETPIYEYPSQDGGYGDQTDRSGRYVGMWKNYLSKIPVIREYVARRKKR